MFRPHVAIPFSLCPRRYRITQNIYLPFTVIPVITEHGRSRIEYEIKIKANFTEKLFATKVVMRVPTPKNTVRAQRGIA
jgi:AP-2 complex subunit mu-1